MVIFINNLIFLGQILDFFYIIILSQHTPEAHYGGENQTSGQSMTDFEAMYAFFHDKCVAMLREITFENGEELTEEGKPFLVLFHGPKDYQSVKDFGNEIFKSLMPVRVSFKILETSENL